MRKSVIAMLIAFSFAVVSCGGTKEVEAETADSVEVVEVETVDSVEAGSIEEVVEVEATEETVDAVK
jgi:hypothetical protein